jgi:hypothetical protein
MSSSEGFDGPRLREVLQRISKISDDLYGTRAQTAVLPGFHPS